MTYGSSCFIIARKILSKKKYRQGGCCVLFQWRLNEIVWSVQWPVWRLFVGILTYITWWNLNTETKQQSKQWVFCRRTGYEGGEIGRDGDYHCFYDKRGITQYLENGKLYMRRYCTARAKKLRRNVHNCPGRKFSSIKAMQWCAREQFRWRKLWNWS